MVDKLSDLTFAVPTYNRNEYLKKLLDSIPADTGAKFAISDNGNFVVDDTTQKHAGHLKISRSEQVIEMYDNWNKAISLVDTTWFMIPSDDDLYYADKFQVLADSLERFKDADVIIFGHNVINEKDEQLSTWVPGHTQVFEAPHAFDSFKYGVSARFPSIVFRTAFVKQMGNIDTTYEFTAGDSLLIQKCMLHGRIAFVNEVIGAYRTWSSNFTNLLIGSKKWLDKIDRWQDEIAAEVKKAGISGFDAKGVKDEVYAHNFISGLSNVRKAKGIGNSIRFALDNRYPFKANIKTQIVIFKSMLLG